jgi:hypothetical protein
MKKRFIVQLVAIFVLLSVLVAPVFTGYAKGDTQDSQSEASSEVTEISWDNRNTIHACVSVGVIRGEGGLIEDEYWLRNTTRAQGLLIGLRLRGLEDSARFYKGTYSFNDMPGLNKAYWSPILAYAYEHPELGLVTDVKSGFRPSEVLTGNEFAKIIMEALGYKQGVDFESADVRSFAQSKGLTVKEGKVTNQDFTVVLQQALKLNNKEGKLFIEDLYQKGALYDRREVKAAPGTDPAIPYAARMRLFYYEGGWLQLHASDQYGQRILPPKGTFSSSDTSKIVLGDQRPGVIATTDVSVDAYGVTSGINTAVVTFKSDDGKWNLSTEVTVVGKSDVNVFTDIRYEQDYQALMVGKTMKLRKFSLIDSLGNFVNLSFHQYYLEVRRADDNDPYGTGDSAVFEIGRQEINEHYTYITAKKAGTETLKIVACKGGMPGSGNPNYIEAVKEFTLTAVNDTDIVGCKVDFLYDKNFMYAGELSEDHNLKIKVSGATVNRMIVQIQSTDEVALPDAFSYKVDVDNIAVSTEKSEIVTVRPVTKDMEAKIKVIGKRGYVIGVFPFHLKVDAPKVHYLYMSAFNKDYVYIYAYDQYGKSIAVPEGTITSSDPDKIAITGTREGYNPYDLCYNISSVGDGPNTATITYVTDDGLFKAEVTVTR